MPWLAACPASLRAPFCWPIRAHTNYSLTQNDGGNDRCFLPFQAYPDAYGDKPGHDGESDADRQQGLVLVPYRPSADPLG
jgi:hypothetical protein